MWGSSASSRRSRASVSSVTCMPCTAPRSTWLAQITILTPAPSSSSKVTDGYSVGTTTTGVGRSQRRMNSRISAAVLDLECMRIMSAPASAEARPRRSASFMPQPAMSASTRAMSRKSGSCRVATAARILPANSSSDSSSRFIPGVETALLREDIVLHADAGDSGALVFFHGAHHVDHIAVAVVDVGDHGAGHGVVDVLGGLEILGHGQEIHVRDAALSRGDGEARRPDHGKAGGLDE